MWVCVCIGVSPAEYLSVFKQIYVFLPVVKVNVRLASPPVVCAMTTNV